MRLMILLAFVTTFTGCQHTQRCTQSCRSVSPFSSCKSRPAGNCCEKPCAKPRCDLQTACRSVKSSCQKACRSCPTSGSKRLGLGWKEFRVPVPTFKEKQSSCGRDSRCADGRCCKTTAPCGSKACRTAPVAGCCQEFRTRPTEATPFLMLPPDQQALNQRQTPGWHTNPRQPRTQSSAGLAQRTQALESQVSEIHSMLRQQPGNVPAQRNDVNMQPPSSWRTMNGVPPIPNSGIEQTAAFGSGSGTYRTAHDPQMWPHSPQNMRRTILR